METRILRTSLLAVTILLFTLGVASAASTCQTWASPNIKIIGVTWGNSTHYISAAPGNKDVPLTVTLETYDTNCAFQNVVGSLELYGGITDYSGSSTSTFYTQSVQPPSILNMVFNLNIASNVTMGPNVSATYPLVIEWDSDNGSVNVKQQLNVQVPLEGAANLSFTVQKPDITAGKVTNVTIEVSNSGTGTISNIGTTVSSSSGVSFLSQPQDISSLAPGQSKNVSLSIYIAPSQAGNSQTGSSVILNMDTHYISPYGHNTTLSSQLGLFASAPSGSSVLVSVPNQTLLSGKIVDTNLMISNQGSDPITNISVVLTPESPLSIVGSDNLNTISEILPGENASLPISLYVQSSSSAVATLDIALNYVTDNQQESISRSISFLNPGNINLTIVSTTISPSSPSIGGIFSITSTLNNVGASSATAASVTPLPPKGIKVLGTNTSFLGSIPIDTPTAFTVSFTVSSSAKAGAYTVPVRLSYLNNLNQVKNETFYYNVSVGGSSLSSTGGSQVVVTNGNGTTTFHRKSGSGGLAILAVVVIIIVAAAGSYLYLRNRKNKAHKK